MSGLTRKNQAGVSGLVGPVMHYTEFDTSSDGSSAWTKPDGVSIVWIEVYGAGGGGGGGNNAGGGNDQTPGGGGGGGSMSWGVYSADALPAALDIVVGAGGSAGSVNSDAGSGSESNVNIPAAYTGAGRIILQGGGGGGGEGGGTNTSAGAGGGGGS